MPRSLPWLNRDSAHGSSTSKRRDPSATSRAKRPKPLDSSDVEVDPQSTPKQTKLRFGEREPSTSPPPDAPTEIFMHEGLDHDDRHRMVEDEFLETAKLFTQHLHAAEYRRMKEAARKQNADTISSILRPVTQRMPDPTRRKVEGVSRAKKQAKLVGSLLSKAGPVEDESDDEGSAWIGTALHGLMDSPRKSTASLLRAASIKSNTEASAGIEKPKLSKPVSSVPRSSTNSHTRPKTATVGSELSQEREDNIETSDDDDGDLNGPLIPKVPTKVQYVAELSCSKSEPKSPPFSYKQQFSATSSSFTKYEPKPSLGSSPRSTMSFTSTLPPSYQPQNQPRLSVDSTSNSLDTSSSRVSAASEDSVSQSSLASAARVARRLEQARLQRLKKEQDDQKRKKRPDTIPTFL